MLLHAGVGDRRLWEGQAPLAERFRVVRPDLRGFGDSPLPGGPFSFVDDVRALLDRLEIERAALVGNSFGGKIALDVALTEPKRTSALVLVAAALAGREGSSELARLDETEDELLDAGRIDEAVELSLRAWLDGPRRDAVPVPPGVRERLAGMQRRAYEVAVAAYEREPAPGPVRWASPPAAGRLGEVAVPTLVVVGRHDFADFREIGDELEAGIPSARKVVLDTAHLPGVERPEELNRLLLDFLGEHAA
ncbi:MAG TPA: alpha/beta hydrolase [Gaiellaceae bacterium]|nr:alpha/beta hydrolase [Gaiellaceae bacterium]